MKTLGDIRQTIQDIWEFVIPPFINLSITAVVLFLVTKEINFPDINLTSENIENNIVIKLLDSFKLKSTVPIFMLVLFLFLLNFLNKAFKAIGTLLTLEFQHSKTPLYVNSPGFYDYWLFFAGVHEPNRLINKIETFVEQEKSKDSWISKLLAEQDKIFLKDKERLTFVKFVIILLVSLLLFEAAYMQYSLLLQQVLSPLGCNMTNHFISSAAHYFVPDRIFLALIIFLAALFYLFLRTAKHYNSRTVLYIRSAIEYEKSQGNSPAQLKDNIDRVAGLFKSEIAAGNKWWWVKWSLDDFNYHKFLSQYRR